MLQALEKRSPPIEQASGELFSRLKSDCTSNIAGAQGNEAQLQSIEKNTIPLDGSLHQALDRRARASGELRGVMFLDPFEGRAGMCAQIALPSAYMASIVWREMVPGSMPPISLQVATILMGICSGQEPWRNPSLIFINALASNKISPGVLAKSCENIFATFASQTFIERINQIATNMATYFEGQGKKKRKAPDTGHDDDDDDHNDDSGRPGPSSRRRPRGRGGHQAHSMRRRKSL